MSTLEFMMKKDINLYMSKIAVDKTYICHWNKLMDRKKILIENLSHLGLNNYEFVESYIAEELNEKEIKNEYPLIFQPTEKGRFLKMSEISLALKHCWIIKDAFSKKYDSILILEDDVAFEKDFIENFNDFKSQLPDDWDIAWVGGCCGLHSNNILDSKNVYESRYSRCTHSFIISKIGISKIESQISNINEAIDWYYNTLIENLKLKNYWFEPVLAKQNIEFMSTIQ